MKKKTKVVFKVVKIIFLTIALIVLSAFAIVQWIPSIADRAKNVKVEGSASWMANISDETFLNEISIPGAHDLGAKNVQLTLFSKCQGRNVEELLDDGFRYLDIRLGVEYAGGKPVMTLYHGFTHCLAGKSIMGAHLTLKKVIDDCQTFLEAHPSETIIFVVKKEHGSESIAEFEKILSTYTTENFLLTDAIPTLGEARGKIVLFRRYNDEAELGKNSGIYLNWSQQKSNDDVSLTYEKCEEGGYTAYVQDRYKYDIEDKWNAFINTVKDTDKLVKEGLVINFLSTNGTPSFGHPYKYAKELNALFLEEDFSCDRLGWVILDFGNAELAEKVYSKN